MDRIEALIPGEYYHIYNRGNNRENLFVEKRNYRYFLELYARYIERVAATYAYCLMPNHFHILLRIKDIEAFPQDWQSSEDCQSYTGPARTMEAATHYASRQFADLFATYTKAFNKAYQRTGSLFAKPFRRKRVDSDAYFQSLVLYIHQNPQRHGFVADFREWPHTSHATIVSHGPTRLQRVEVLAWFDSVEEYIAVHQLPVDDAPIQSLLLD